MRMAGPKIPQLTVKQRALVKGVASGMSITNAGIAAGYKPKNADRVASLALKRPQVASYLTNLMDRKGLTDSQLLTTLKEGLEANKVISATVILKAGDPTVTERTADAKSMDFIDVPDHPTRHKFLETGLKLRGHLQPETPPPVSPVSINILSVDGLTKEKIFERLRSALGSRRAA